MNASNVPVYIINRNRLTSTRELIDWLNKKAYTENIIILDNASDYPPLLDYYKFLAPKNVTVVENGNDGPFAFWQQNWHLKQGTPYIVTDSDCIPSPLCPSDLIERMLWLLQRFPGAGKVGAGIRIDNLPDHYAKKAKVLSWESRFWKQHACPEAYYAAVDTTFALYPARGVFRNDDGNLRTAPPYLVEHTPWYCDSTHLSGEEQYYKDHAAAGWCYWYTVF